MTELGLAATLLAAGGFGAVHGVRYLRATVATQTAPAPAPAAPLETRRELSSLPDLRVSLETTGTFLGMSDELLLDRVRTQPITRFKLNHGGSSLSFRVDFADGSRAAWKPMQTNMQSVPRKEVAAYRLNRLLGLHAVPPAAPRAVTRDELLEHLHPDSLVALPRIKAETVFGPDGRTIGTASYWIPIIKDSGFDTPEGRKQTQAWLTIGQEIPPDRLSMAAQVSTLIVFDFLTSNPDRYSGGNMKMSEDGKQLYYMDNTMSFYVDGTGNERNREVLFKTQRFSRALYQALDRVTVTNLQRALAEELGTPYEILTPAEIAAVAARRAVVQRYIADLIAQHGEHAVLFFP
ncbi:MAG TPA: hypothetical protein VIF57_00725 [Polyangia bacterium]|jgi:hypothetical protein